MAGKPGGRGELSHALERGKSPDHKGEKRDGRQAELDRPQTSGGGKRTKGPDGSSITKLQELSLQGDSPEQVGKASKVKEPNEADQIEGSVTLGRTEGKKV